MDYSDQRIHLVHEFITNAKLIKLYNWQNYFSKRIIETRAKQNGLISKLALYGSLTRFVGTVSPMLVSLVTFAIYVGVERKPLDATTVFTALMLFNIMKEPLSKLPESSNLLIKTLNSSKRIETFLKTANYQKPASHWTVLPSVSSSPATAVIPSDAKSTTTTTTTTTVADERQTYDYYLKNVACGWTENESELILRDIYLRIPRGKLIFVVGSVGSGKSTLLQTLLGETYVHRGRVEVSGRATNASYCVQQPWILSDTIRNNITFGESFDLERYIETITKCALIRDFEMLKDGDMSVVGDHQEGVGQLSGGQR